MLYEEQERRRRNNMETPPAAQPEVPIIHQDLRDEVARVPFETFTSLDWMTNGGELE